MSRLCARYRKTGAFERRLERFKGRVNNLRTEILKRIEEEMTNLKSEMTSQCSNFEGEIGRIEGSSKDGEKRLSEQLSLHGFDLSVLRTWGTKLDSRIISHFPPLFEEFYSRQIQLLWRGSRDGFDSKTFHSRCDNHRNTLTMIRDERGFVFGCFTSAMWQSEDSSLQGGGTDFLFTLNNPHKIPASRYPVSSRSDNYLLSFQSLGPAIVQRPKMENRKSPDLDPSVAVPPPERAPLPSLMGQLAAIQEKRRSFAELVDRYRLVYEKIKRHEPWPSADAADSDLSAVQELANDRDLSDVLDQSRDKAFSYFRITRYQCEMTLSHESTEDIRIPSARFLGLFGHRYYYIDPIRLSPSWVASDNELIFPEATTIVRQPVDKSGRPARSAPPLKGSTKTEPPLPPRPESSTKTEPPPQPRIHPKIERLLLRPLADQFVERQRIAFQSKESNILAQIDSECGCGFGILVSDKCNVNPSLTFGSDDRLHIPAGTFFTGSRTFLVKEIEVFEITT
jgi:hypothetical protein